MSETISSADPQRLYSYAINALEIDSRLVDAATQLEGLLYHFVTRCAEPGFVVPHVLYLLDELRTLARLGEEADRWVEEISRKFETANQQDLNAPLSTAAPNMTSSLPAAPVAAYPTEAPTPHADINSASASAAVEQQIVAPPLLQPPLASVGHTPGVALLQGQPQGDEQVLNLLRYGADQQVEVGAISQRELTTVGDQIKEYGCLITSYTMVLQDNGADLSVTDLYKANFLAQTGQDFDQAAADGVITLTDLYAHPNLVAQATQGHFATASAILEPDPAQALPHLLGTYGSIVMQTMRHGVDHWIVVDGANADGTFTVRDPLVGLQQEVTLTNSANGDYQVHPSRVFQYLVSTS